MFSKNVDVQAPAWPAPQGEIAVDKVPLPLLESCQDGESSGRPQTLTPFGQTMERALLAVCDALTAAAPGLDDLDSRQVALKLSNLNTAATCKDTVWSLSSHGCQC